MRVLITNAFGLCSKLAEFQHTLCKSKADIAIVIETKLTREKMSVAETSVAGYHPPLRLDRTAQGGGVAVWVNEELSYEHLGTINYCDHELLWLAINLNGRKQLVTAIPGFGFEGIFTAAVSRGPAPGRSRGWRGAAFDRSYSCTRVLQSDSR